MMRGWDYGPYFSHGWGSWEVVTVVLFALLLAAAIAAVTLVVWSGSFRRSQSPSPSSQASAPPSADRAVLRILEERFARGEIDREDFLQRRRDLQSTIPE